METTIINLIKENFLYTDVLVEFGDRSVVTDGDGDQIYLWNPQVI